MKESRRSRSWWPVSFSERIVQKSHSPTFFFSLFFFFPPVCLLIKSDAWSKSSYRLSICLLWARWLMKTYSESRRSVPSILSVFKIESNFHWILFSLHGSHWKFLFIVISKARNSYFNPPYPPPNRGNIRIKPKQITKQCLNNHLIMKVCFQIIFEFTWYVSSTFTESRLNAGLLFFFFFISI